METWIPAKGSCGQLLKKFSFSFPNESVGNQSVKILYSLPENMGRSEMPIWKCVSIYVWVGLEMLSGLIRKIISSEQKKWSGEWNLSAWDMLIFPSSVSSATAIHQSHSPVQSLEDIESLAECGNTRIAPAVLMKMGVAAASASGVQ